MMASLAEDEQPPNPPVQIEEDCDDFVLIELIENNNGSSNATSVTTPTTRNEHSKLCTDYEDFVELSFEDVEASGPEVRSENDKRSLYGIRLFQYSPESEGNIYITNEEL